MTFVAASSTAWTMSDRLASGAPASSAAERTNVRTSASAPTLASTRIDRAVRTIAVPPCPAGLREPGEVGRGALHELAGALPPGELAVPDDDRAARQDDVGPALDRAALVARVVDVHVVGLRADHAGRVRVVDDEIGVRADRDRALLRIHPEELRRRRRDDLDPALPRDPAG